MMSLAKAGSFLTYKALLLLLVISAGVSPGNTYSICEIMCYQEEYTLWSECSTYRGIGYQTSTIIRKKYSYCGDTSLYWFTNNIMSSQCMSEPWSEWGDCSTTCGEGTRNRTRKCVAPYECIGSVTQFKPCADNPTCTNFSEYNDWSQWSECYPSCGEGTRTRTRTCPGPFECIGNSTESESCLDNPKCTCTIKEEQCQFATVAPVYYTQCKNDDTICSGGGGESDPCEGDSPDPEEMKFCTAKMAEISDLTDAQKPWVLCSEDCFVGSNPKNFTETTGCTAEVRECKFPFSFNDKEYTECTNDLLFISDYDDRTEESFKWCATSTNSDGSMKKGKWGRCDEATCNIVGAP